MRFFDINPNMTQILSEGVNMGPQIIGQIASDSSVILGFEAEFMHDDYDYDDVFHKYRLGPNDWMNISYEQITEAYGWDDDKFKWYHYDDWLEGKKEDYRNDEDYQAEAIQETFDDNEAEVIAALRAADPEKYEEHEDDEIEDDFWPEIKSHVLTNMRERYQQLFDERMNDWFATGFEMSDCWEEIEYEEATELLQQMDIITPEYAAQGIEEGIHDIAAQIESYLGIEFEQVEAGYNSTDKHKDGWFLETDGDGPEIISAALPLPEQLENLEETLDYIRDHGRTTVANGLHLNLSIEGKKGRDYDLMKLGLFLGEAYVLQQFRRGQNRNANPQMEYVHRRVRDLKEKYPQVRDWVKGWHETHDDPELNDAIQGIIRGVFHGDRYRSFNVKHLQEHGYIEFRIAGNEDYEKNWSDVRDAILRFAYVMKLASDPSAQLKEYNKKLVKFLGAALSDGSEVSSDMDAVDRYLYGIEHKMLPNRLQFATTEQYPRGFFRSTMKSLMFTKRPIERDSTKVEFAEFYIQMLDYLHRDSDLKKHVKLYLKRFWKLSGVSREYAENMAGNMYDWGKDAETGLIKFRGKDTTKEDFLKQVDEYLDSLEK